MQTFHSLWKKFISQFVLPNQELISLFLFGAFCLNSLNFFHIDLPKKELAESREYRLFILNYHILICNLPKILYNFIIPPSHFKPKNMLVCVLHN